MRKALWALAVPAIVFIIAGILAVVEFSSIAERLDVVVTQNAQLRTSAAGRTIPALATETPRATATPSPTAIPEPTETLVPAERPPGYWALEEHPVTWEINCENEWAWDGFLLPEFGNYCNPGVLSGETITETFIRNHWGALSSYAPGVMEGIEDSEGVARGHGVTLMSCQLIGYTVWLRVPGIHDGFQGPFTVVDCSRPEHLFYHVAGMGLVAEVGYATAERWGIRAAPRVDVAIGRRPNGSTWRGVNLTEWWVGTIEWEDAFGIYGAPRGTPTS